MYFEHNFLIQRHYFFKFNLVGATEPINLAFVNLHQKSLVKSNSKNIVKVLAMVNYRYSHYLINVFPKMRLITES